MKKWLDKYNDDVPQAQNGIEGTMGGLTDQGFDYNGAWGGTMQTGGSLPGSVGFMYARTQGAAPSNGPYAKKTKASAQNGRAVSDNTRLKPIVTEKPINREVVKSTEPFKPKDNRSIFSDSRTKERINNPNTDFVQGVSVDTFIDQIPYSAIALTAKAINEGKPLTAISELVKQPLHAVGDVIMNALQENPEGIDVKTLEEKTFPFARLAANATFGNPIITQIGKQRVESGKKKGSKWYDFTAYELPALYDAAKSYGVDDNTFTQFIEDNWESSGRNYKKILDLANKKFSKKQNGGEMKYYQEGLDFKPKNISQDGSKNPKKKKTLILAEHDPELWDYQDKNYTPEINPFITEAAGIKKYVNKYFPNEDVEVVPTYKHNIREALSKSDPNTRLVVMGHSGNKMFGIPTAEFIESVGNTRYENCYAGICYGDDLIGIGRPDADRNIAGVQIPGRYPESYNLQNFNIRSNHEKWVGFSPVDRGGEEGFRDSFFRRTENPEVDKLNNQLKKIWSDQNVEYEKKTKAAKPIESKLEKIYSQNKQTLNLPKAADTKELDYIQYPARTANYGDPLRFDPREILRKKEEGGEIKKDDMGYWNPENWGEPVEIDSNQITMEGVYEPLIGISDTGDVQYMEPGGEYEFDGESVIEYPVMQKGGRAPIYTEDPKDPRLRAYQDSLSLYNDARKYYDVITGSNSGSKDKSLRNLNIHPFNKNYTQKDALGQLKENAFDIPKENLKYFDQQAIQNQERFKRISKKTFQSKINPIGTYPLEGFAPAYKKPVQPVLYKKPQSKQEVVKKPEPITPIVERRQNVYEGSPVYSPGVGSGLPSALIGFANQKGDTTYIKPEDYERFAVPKYAKEYIETKKQKNGGWLDKYN